MTLIIDAINMCEAKTLEYKIEIDKIKNTIGRQPEFVIINASDDEGNARYIKGKIKEGEKSGLKVSAIKLEKDCTQHDVLSIIDKCNNEKI